jgi:hypothetical protein
MTNQFKNSFTNEEISKLVKEAREQGGYVWKGSLKEEGFLERCRTLLTVGLHARNEIYETRKTSTDSFIVSSKAGILIQVLPSFFRSKFEQRIGEIEGHNVYIIDELEEECLIVFNKEDITASRYIKVELQGA